MNVIKTKKLKRADVNIFLGTATMEEIESWRLQKSSLQTYNEVIQINTEEIEIIKEENSIYSIKVDGGIISSVLPKGGLNEEYPVLITNHSPIKIIIQGLLGIENFRILIDVKNINISSNSTKIMTIQTLESIVSFAFHHYTFNKINILINDFLKYIEDVIKDNPELKVTSVSGVKQLKQKSIINSSLSWFIIFKHFIESYERNRGDMIIPKLNLVIKCNNWEGGFFDRNNPLWSNSLNQKRKFYPTKENLENVYSNWKIFNEVSK